MPLVDTKYGYMLKNLRYIYHLSTGQWLTLCSPVIIWEACCFAEMMSYNTDNSVHVCFLRISLFTHTQSDCYCKIRWLENTAYHTLQAFKVSKASVEFGQQDGHEEGVSFPGFPFFFLNKKIISFPLQIMERRWPVPVQGSWAVSVTQCWGYLGNGKLWPERSKASQTCHVITLFLPFPPFKHQKSGTEEIRAGMVILRLELIFQSQSIHFVSRREDLMHYLVL